MGWVVNFPATLYPSTLEVRLGKAWPQPAASGSLCLAPAQQAGVSGILIYC